MSSKATSSPVDGSTRFCLMRAPVLDDSWWKRTVLGEVALYIFTGTLTSPKLIAPLQIARGMGSLCIPHAGRRQVLRPVLPTDRQWRRAADLTSARAATFHNRVIAPVPSAARRPRPRRPSLPGCLGRRRGRRRLLPGDVVVGPARLSAAA